MTSLPIPERRERIEEDDGDLDDIVLQVINSGRSSCYHDPDGDCQNIRQASKTKKRPRGWCQKNDMPPCKRCVLGTAEPRSGPSLAKRVERGDVSVDHEFEWDGDDQVDTEEVA